MIDEVLRIPKEKVFEPLARSLSAVSPTAVTLTACLVGVSAGVAASQNWNTAALGLWGVNRLLDGLDGTMARVNQRQSDLGGYLDTVLDSVVYAAIPLGLAFGSSQPGVFVALTLMLASFYINSATWMYLAALLEKRNLGAKTNGELTTVAMPGGLIEGLETILFYTLFLIFPQWLPALFAVMTGLVLLTSIQRVIWAVRNLKPGLVASQRNPEQRNI